MKDFIIMILQILLLVGNAFVFISMFRLSCSIRKLEIQLKKELEMIEDHRDRVEKVYGITHDDL